MRIMFTMLMAVALMAAPTVSFAQDARGMIAESARSHGVDVSLALAVGHVESGFNCRAIGGVGERGPMQIRPQTARAMGVYGSLSNCANAIEASMRYLKLAIATHGQNCGGISAYNRGIYARPRCTAYGRNVLAAQRRYR
jgi:soluble lytic murein transglycosylase-like protein